MSWNYRVIRTDDAEQREESFGIHEVYYNEQGEPDTWTVDPIAPHGTDLTELRDDTILMMNAFLKPAFCVKSYVNAEGETVEYLEEIEEEE